MYPRIGGRRDRASSRRSVAYCSFSIHLRWGMILTCSETRIGLPRQAARIRSATRAIGVHSPAGRDRRKYPSGLDTGKAPIGTCRVDIPLKQKRVFVVRVAFTPSFSRSGCYHESVI